MLCEDDEEKFLIFSVTFFRGLHSELNKLSKLNHQMYGAYVIRKSYSDNLLSGTFLSVSLAALVLLVPLLSSFKGKEVGKSGPEGRTPIVLEPPPIIEFLPPPVV